MSKARSFALAAVSLVVLGASASARAETWSPLYGGSGGTTSFTDRCPANIPLMTGVNLRAGAYVDGIAGECWYGDAATQYRGGFGGAFTSRSCPMNYVLVGILANAGSFLDGANLICRFLPDIRNKVPGNTNEVTLVHFGGTGGTTHTPWRCPNGEAVIGFRGAAGFYMDRFGLICATP